MSLQQNLSTSRRTMVRYIFINRKSFFFSFLSLSLSLYFSPSLYLSISLAVSIFFSFSVSVCLSLYLSLPLSLSHTPYLFLSFLTSLFCSFFKLSMILACPLFAASIQEETYLLWTSYQSVRTCHVKKNNKIIKKN